MEKYTAIFQNDSDYVKIGDYFYKKEDFCEYLKQNDKKIFYSEKATLDKVTAFEFFFRGEDFVKVNILINSNDKFVDYLDRLDVFEYRLKKLKLIFIKLNFFAIILALLLFNKEPILEFIDNLEYKITYEKMFDGDFFDSLLDTYGESNENLSELENKTINTFENNDWLSLDSDSLETANEYAQSLEIEETIDEVLPKGYIQSKKEYSHELDLTLFYDFSNNSFKKEEIVPYLYEYSLQRKDWTSYDMMSEEELSSVLDYASIYIEYMKNLDSNFDIEHFLCSILNTMFLKSDSGSLELMFCYAMTGHSYDYGNILVLNNSNIERTYGTIKEEDLKKIIIHELNHLYEMECLCENKDIIFSSVGFALPEVNSYYLNLFQEWSSETICVNCNGTPIMSCYFKENEIIHNLEFALSVNPNYEIGTVLQSCAKHDPFTLYKSFPYIYDEKEELIDYLEMLKCYDLSIIFPYAYYAQTKHIELFYKNLFYLNESTDENLLEYDFFLINLFEVSMREQNRTLGNNVDIDLLLEFGYKNLFYDYLKEKYPNASLDELKAQNNYDKDELYLLNIKEKYGKYISEEQFLLYEEMIRNLYAKYHGFGYDSSHIYQK